MSDGGRRREANAVDLYLVRHGHAGNADAWRGPDDTRPLSARGRDQAARLATFLARVGAPPLILTSPKLRASETAAPIADATRAQIRVEPILGSAPDLVDIERLLSQVGDPDRVLLVGHDPDFTQLVEELTGAASIPMPKAALARLTCRRPLVPGSGVLRWLVPPDLLAEA
ncbi:MAG: histidine phosphatase family protein [Chloroflexi bacterium]|nr:histidine phosphatase family protein [Chloroflexota bacterium]